MTRPLLVLHPKDWNTETQDRARAAGYNPIMADVATTRVLAPAQVTFTREDVETLRRVAEDEYRVLDVHGEPRYLGEGSVLFSLAARIEALLPPETSNAPQEA